MGGATVHQRVAPWHADSIVIAVAHADQVDQRGNGVGKLLGIVVSYDSTVSLLDHRPDREEV